MANRFTDSRYQNKEQLTRLIRDKFKNIAENWGTRIDKAEKIALYQLFTAQNGGDRPNAANVMLIFTDGKPTGQQEKDFTPFQQLTYGLQAS